jgi:hypothetical protein
MKAMVHNFLSNINLKSMRQLRNSSATKRSFNEAHSPYRQPWATKRGPSVSATSELAHLICQPVHHPITSMWPSSRTLFSTPPLQPSRFDYHNLGIMETVTGPWTTEWRRVHPRNDRISRRSVPGRSQNPVVGLLSGLLTNGSTWPQRAFSFISQILNKSTGVSLENATT